MVSEKASVIVLIISTIVAFVTVIMTRMVSVTAFVIVLIISTIIAAVMAMLYSREKRP